MKTVSAMDALASPATGRSISPNETITIATTGAHFFDAVFLGGRDNSPAMTMLGLLFSARTGNEFHTGRVGSAAQGSS
jgi:hypothetical protein